MSGFLLVSPGSYLLIGGTDRLLISGSPAPTPPSEFAGAGLLPNIRRMVAERERLWAIEQERLRREKNTALVVIHARASVFVSAVTVRQAGDAISRLSAVAFVGSATVEAASSVQGIARLGGFASASVQARNDDDDILFLMRSL